ncbi:MAG: tripartite tricarboxylate transporter substrate binding protein [Betaproteobacteria bacterium]|nr:tripartite tricarboxylate transporter substrate binding protein [Betaproteobacteria bacterium]
MNKLAGIGRVIIGLILLGASVQAFGQAYPARPIRLVVPFPPGGAVDFYARVVQQPLSEALGQQLVIDNKAGASGMVGAEIVAKSPPDGYTLLLGNIASLAINVGLYAKMPYDPLKDLTPIVRTVDVNYVLVVHPSVPANTVPELVAYAKANPGKLSYGSAGSGSLPHLGTELFKAQTGIDMLHVPYKGGGPMVTDLLGGTVQVVIGDQANLMPHVQSGKLRALAVATSKRSPNFPNLPTIAESGLAGYDSTAWQGLAGPAGLPPDVVKRLNEAFNAVMAMPAVREKLTGGGLEVVGGPPEQFARFIAAEITKWTKIAKDVGAKVD